MVPDTSTISSKQDFAALSTVTAAPRGASVSSAARAGVARRRARARSKVRKAKERIGAPVRFRGSGYQKRAPGAKPLEVQYYDIRLHQFGRVKSGKREALEPRRFS